MGQPPQRRLEDRIQALVPQVIAAEEPDELADVLRQLRAALHEHANRLRLLAAKKLSPSREARRAPVVMENAATEDFAAD